MRPAAMSQYPSRIIFRIGRVRVVYFYFGQKFTSLGMRFTIPRYAGRQTDPLGNANSLGHEQADQRVVLPRLSPGIDGDENMGRRCAMFDWLSILM